MPGPMEYRDSGKSAGSMDALGGLIQSPMLDSKGEPTQRAIRDAGQGRDVCRTLTTANRQRQIVNSRILAKYNAERPYDSTRLENEGLGWKQNFTTKPLPQMIEKVAPRFCDAIAGLKYLTNAKLSDKWLNSTEKTEKFREVITKTCRNRRGWRTLVEDTAFDDALFGHTVCAWLDEYGWFPVHFNQDENFLPDGCKQSAEYAQFVCLKEILLPHELYIKIKDREAAETAGYDIKGCIQAINNASPGQTRDLLNVGGTLETWYQNAIRELNVGVSYMSGASVIVVYHLLAREVTGKVSHYSFAGPELVTIFEKDDRFDSMTDCCSFFAFQKGNSTMHGSKGIGRDIYELAGMIDRTRNEIVDRSLLSGKTVFQGDVKRIHTFKMSIIGASVIVPTGWNMLEQRIDGNVESFLKLDAYFSLLVDQLIGSTSPRQFGGERTTKAEVDLFAAREEEGKDVKIRRFMEQFCDMMTTIQKRICSTDTDEEDAKEAQAELLKYMTREEIDELAKQPVAGTVHDLTPQERQMIAVFSSEKRGNPNYNQRALEVEDATARVGADFSKRVLLPVNDATEQAEQMRTQQFELTLLMQGQPVPVSPRDNHLIHLQMLMPMAEAQGQAMLSGQSDTGSFEALVAHITEHTNRAEEQGAPAEMLKPYKDFVKRAGPAIAQLKSVDQQAGQLAAESDAYGAEDQQALQEQSVI